MTTKVVANGKPAVLMMNMLMPYLRDSLESKFNLLPLWEQPNKEAYLTSKADSIRGVVTSNSSLVDSKFVDRLPNLEIVASFSVGLDKVRRCLLTKPPLYHIHTTSFVREQTLLGNEHSSLCKLCYKME